MLSITSWVKNLLVSKTKRGSSSVSVADEIIVFLKNLVIQESLIANELARYEKVKKTKKKQKSILYVPLYFALENSVVEHRFPLVRKAYTKDELRREIRDTFPINKLETPFRLIFLPRNEQATLLFEIAVQLLADYVITYIGRAQLIDIITATVKGKISGDILTREQTVNFGFLKQTLRDFSSVELVSFFKDINSSLFRQIVISHGEKKALEVVKGIFTLIKDSYENELVSEFLTVMPESVLETEQLAYLSHEQLEEKIRQSIAELKKLNEGLEEKVFEATKGLKEANIRLKEFDRVKTQFITIAAHQLRTPATETKWRVEELLANVHISRDTEAGLRIVYNSNDRLIAIVDDLLNVSGIEEGRWGIHLMRQPFDVVVRQVFEGFQNKARAKKIDFILTMPSNMPELDLDKEKIEIVLGTLLDNALWYTHTSGKVSMEVVREGDHSITTVRDTGIGIRKSEFPQVFTKFYRSSEALQVHTDGSGLNLFIAKNIIESHKGTIGFTSEPGKGSSFYFSLPIPV